MSSSFDHGIEVYGAALLPGVGGNVITGKVFFVDSGHANADDSASKQGNRDAPFATMNFADTQCESSNGDRVIVMPGHAETVSAVGGLGLNKVGVFWDAIGRGSDRPTINFTTVVGADMDVDEANIIMRNFLFTGGIDALTGPIDINAADFALIGCETRDVTGETVDFIVTDANADRLLIDGWKHTGASGSGAQSAISIVGGDDVSIQNFNIDGNFGTAAIENVTTAAVNLNIGGLSMRNLIRTRNSADVAVTCVGTTTGWIDNIFARLQDDAANITEAFLGADMQYGFNLYVVNADGERAFQFNQTATADAIV